ncbi:MAG: hypothetical protein JRD92_01880 [Deltaproteobacteria bacterium]|nr:hypothetical protein [Deltaproteobacteria bacterium]MBW2162117.1 hypothetical protein [Deltaproteobacteria bacterium]MBW2585679.1 hypothetical protein [Deltaproteobacteria bacterium]
MSKIDHAKPIATKKLGIGRSVITCMLLALAVGCGDAEAPPAYVGPGTGGSGGSGSASGTGGTGGMGGTGATGGGGISGSGGVAGTGGTGSIGGTGGTGGVATKSICRTPLDAGFCESSGNCCETDLDCAFAGYVCVDSGCKTDAGAPIKQCQPSRGGSCVDEGDCPSASDYGCIAVGGGPKRCVRVTPGCDSDTETYDCPPGFSCESSACVDRRMSCDSYRDCPKSHVCTTTPISRYCIRTHRTCKEDTDCGGFAAVGSFCADVDSDGTKECVGAYNDPLEACFNADCPGSAPVCESGSAPSSVSCGDYGLCLTNSDCDVAEGFECVGLWQDGRKECVPTGGTCNQVTDCLLPNQVCAAPRNGGPPSCQSGSAP